MKPFLKKLLRFLTPILVLLTVFLLLYVYNDPFKVLKPYDDYSYSRVFTNRDFVSTAMFIKQYPKHKYNSFIFGSSRTMAYRPEVWGRYVDADSGIFVFDAAGESVYGIYHKLKYLDSEKIELKNIWLERNLSILLQVKRTKINIILLVLTTIEVLNQVRHFYIMDYVVIKLITMPIS